MNLFLELLPPGTQPYLWVATADSNVFIFHSSSDDYVPHISVYLLDIVSSLLDI